MDISLPAIETFVDALIAEKFAGQDMDDAVKAEIRRELTERLNQYLTLRTIETVGTADPQALNQLSDLIKTNPTPEQVNTFIRNFVKEPDVLVSQFFSDFRSLYIGQEKKPN